ncbi:bifunctional protein-serine/threonine kinase/phosphatase [Aquabacterium sp.]|jgi:serine/threonine protein phosphatase PrpC|uniref:bifunctional protein-serine/threonine kinase/phosphatase n=1 Tax=Aquabacterium sp. TaxID=1872578 RepID=UPI002489DEAD|nr:bifunctional protein-serine/threonine kinase/phosphatase [Aquabacterium sp.]MDI1350951.1 bifunctional protein-serine/threonine kinase/phosphatase [Aquabacterium sp.]
MSFDLDIGFTSERGPRTGNEDFALVRQPGPSDAAWGVIAALADGVSTGGLGLEAAQSTVMSLVEDWYATPATWDPTVALDRVIQAHNGWLVDHNRRRLALEGRMAPTGTCTLTAVVLRAHGFTLAHVGDSRAYLIRDGECTQLTQDHVMGRTEFQNGLTRAVGLDDALRVDYLDGDLRIGDTLVLTSDGVHGYIKPATLHALAGTGSAQEASQALVDKALASGGRDNTTAVVLRVQGLDVASLADMSRRGHQLPVPPRLKEGDVIDQHRVEASVFSNGVHRVYRVRSLVHGTVHALKTLHESRASDAQEREMLAHEAWLAARVSERNAEGLLHVTEPVHPTAFYTLSDWLEGESLASMLDRQASFSVSEVVAAASSLARTLGRLHQHGVIHRDIKPDNLHRGADGQWRILDLGVALSGKEPESLRVLHAGTPSYMNPEQWSDDPALGQATPQSDLFALGVTLYVWLTGRLPYGEIEPYQLSRYRRDPLPPSRLRPDVPIWLDHIVLKAVAREPKARFETAEELRLALERGASRPLTPARASSLLERDPAAVWKIAFGVAMLFNVLLVYWLVFLPRR